MHVQAQPIEECVQSYMVIEYVLHALPHIESLHTITSAHHTLVYASHTHHGCREGEGVTHALNACLDERTELWWYGTYGQSKALYTSTCTHLAHEDAQVLGCGGLLGCTNQIRAVLACAPVQHSTE